jgi:hypothetical protein
MIRQMFIGVRFIFSLSFLIGATAARLAGGTAAPSSDWVFRGYDGRLVYKTDDQGNSIPDFSNVGYHGGGVAIPVVPVKATVEPLLGDAGARIQAAIDKVSSLPPDQNGLRGAVLLKKGRYPIAGSLYLRVSGVVLRGEGQNEDGTVLIATGATQRSLIIAGGQEVAADTDEEDNNSGSSFGGASWRTITDPYVPVGAHQFHLDDVDGLKVGDEIVVKRPSTAEWIHAIGMDRIPPASHPVTQWKPGSKDLYFTRVIVAIAGHEITVEAPMVMALDKKYGGGEATLLTRDDTLQEIGVENLRGDSAYKTAIDERHGWVFIDYASVRNAWVRRVTSVHFGYSCVYVHKQSRAVTIDACACLDPISIIEGGRRYSFALDGQLTLVEHCYAHNARHAFVMHALAAGPNVFFDCLAVNAYADSGPHHRWSAGVLYDNVRVAGAADSNEPSAGGLNIRNRGNSGTGHGWTGANQVAWNCTADQMIIEQPPTAQNWAIGCIATKSHAGDAYWDSLGRPVQPQSLFLTQLHERLGATSAVLP